MQGRGGGGPVGPPVWADLQDLASFPEIKPDQPGQFGPKFPLIQNFNVQTAVCVELTGLLLVVFGLQKRLSFFTCIGP